MFTPPAHVHIEYRQNVHKLTDAAKTIDERAATFDGALHNSNLHSLDDCIHKKMKGRLRKWMVPVMQHVSALLPHSCCVSLLELFVKVDTAGRIWLLPSVRPLSPYSVLLILPSGDRAALRCAFSGGRR